MSDASTDASDAVVHLPVREEEQGGRRKEFVLCFVPSGSGACERVLEERRVRGTFSLITSLEVRLLPLDADLLSMEYPLGFKAREHSLASYS